MQISCAVTAQLISIFDFATRIVQFLFFLNPKFQASSLLLCLYRSVCVKTWLGSLKTSFLTLRLICVQFGYMNGYLLGKICSLLTYSFWLFPTLVIWEVVSACICSGPEVIKFFSSPDQLSMKFQLRINVEIVKLSGNFRFKTKKLVIYPAHKC